MHEKYGSNVNTMVTTKWEIREIQNNAKPSETRRWRTKRINIIKKAPHIEELFLFT
jgi:hypothetical protein